MSLKKDTGQPGPAKILASAADAGVQTDEMAATQKIPAAEAGVQTDPMVGVRKIMAAMLEGRTRDAMDPNDRIRRCAGLPTKAKEDFAKSLFALDELGGMLHQPGGPARHSRRWTPKPSRLAKALEGHRFVPASAAQRRPRPSEPEAAPVAQRARATRESQSRRSPWADMPVPPPHEAGIHYFDFRDRLAGDLRARTLTPTPESLMDHTHRVYGLPIAAAAEWTERFLADTARHRERRQPAAS